MKREWATGDEAVLLGTGGGYWPRPSSEFNVYGQSHSVNNFYGLPAFLLFSWNISDWLGFLSRICSVGSSYEEAKNPPSTPEMVSQYYYLVCIQLEPEFMFIYLPPTVHALSFKAADFGKLTMYRTRPLVVFLCEGIHFLSKQSWLRGKSFRHN